MSRRGRINGLTTQVLDGEPLVWVGRVVSSTGGSYSAIVNGRAEPMTSVAKNDFAFNGMGHEDGDEVLIVASSLNSQPVIVGQSPWALNMDGTAYDE